MKIIDLPEATETLATYAAEVAQGPVIIRRQARRRPGRY